MKTATISFAIGFLALFAALSYASSASAQALSCAGVYSNLSVGSRSSDVRALQTFLVAQNYPGGGSWMITGYYGSATQAAVRLYQQTHGLAITGSVDVPTRASMNASCGGGYSGSNYYNYNYNYGYNYGYPNNNYNYQYPYNYNQCGTYPYYYNCTNTATNPTLTSMSPTYGGPGTQVTVYGTGFSATNNTVYVGGTTLRNISSYNGTTLSFAMPSNVTGLVSVSVGNGYGVSNALTFNADGVINPWGPCGYNYQYCPQPTGGYSISFLSPNSGAVGQVVTVYGSGFSSDNNAVHFGNGIIAGVRSMDGRTLTFTVPSTISGYGYQPIGLGTYDVWVSNSAGQQTNKLPFTITALSSSDVLKITSVSGPTSLAVNQNGTWTINVQGVSGSYITASVKWGDENLYGYQLTAPQTIYGTQNNLVTFSHSYSQSGTYTVVFTVQNSYGQSNTSSITVTVSGTAVGLALSSLSPSSGAIGSTITLTGSGFTSDNTIHFGIGGKLHVASYNNGTTLYFQVPAYVSPCDLQTPGTYCAQYMQPVLPGPMQVKVENQNGISQILYFQVQ